MSSFLFVKNLSAIIRMGINVTDLFNSNIFSMVFDYDEWPSTHNDDQTYLRPFNDSIFKLRKNYRSIFPEDNFLPLTEQEDIDSSKVFKIKYSINLLPKIGIHANWIKENGIKKIVFENEDE